MTITDEKIISRYRELKTIDARCNTCKYWAPYASGDDLGDCTHDDGANTAWKDDFACYLYQSLGL